MSKKRSPNLKLGVGAGLGLARTIGATNHTSGGAFGAGDISNPNQAPVTL